MRSLPLIALSLLLVICSSWANAKALTASVDRYRMGEDETLTLIISYDDSNVSGQPNLAGLESNFEIMGSSSSSETRIVNGNFSSTKKWRYTLMPKKRGKLLIPSFSIHDVYSEPIEIEVVDNASIRSSQGGNRGDLFVEASVNKREAYVQEMITLTLRIYTSIQIAQPVLPELNLPGFMIEKIGESQFETRENDRNYYVLQYQYALFSNQSGEHTLPKQRYQIAQIISNGPRSLFNIPGFDTQTQARFLSTPDIPIRIKAIPDKRPVDYWLASDDVTLTDNWSPEQTIELGTPITRRIEIKALGNLAANIPPLPEQSVRGLKSYPEQAELNNARAGENLLATRQENIAIVAVAPGRYTLPEIRLHWWSNKEKQFKVSTLPERHLIVQGTANLPQNSATPDNPSAESNVSPDSLSDQQAMPDVISNMPFYLSASFWMAVSAVLFLLWLSTLAVFMMNKKSIPPTAGKHKSSSRESLKHSLKEVKQACLANDAKQARSRLIHWAQLQWDDASILSLQEVKQQANNPQFNQLLDELDSTLYREAAFWNGKNLAEFMQAHSFSSLPKSDNAELPKLYS